eukprot:10697285-Alexandrium_andersonii.AAC.1
MYAVPLAQQGNLGIRTASGSMHVCSAMLTSERGRESGADSNQHGRLGKTVPASRSRSTRSAGYNGDGVASVSSGGSRYGICDSGAHDARDDVG